LLITCPARRSGGAGYEPGGKVDQKSARDRVGRQDSLRDLPV